MDTSGGFGGMFSDFGFGGQHSLPGNLQRRDSESISLMSLVVTLTQIAGGEQEDLWTDGGAHWWAEESSWIPSSSSFPSSSISPTFLPVLTHSSYPPVSFVFPFLSLPFLLLPHPLLQTLRGLGRPSWIGWGWLRCLLWHLSRVLWLTVPPTCASSCGERHFLWEDGL